MKKSIIFSIIIGVVTIALSAILLFALVSYAQAKQRDVERLSDIASIRLSLESYFFYRQSYPLAENTLTLGESGARVLCSSNTGIQDVSEGCSNIFMDKIPQDPLSNENYYYLYQSDGKDYSLIFNLEKSDSGLSYGEHTATASGIK